MANSSFYYLSDPANFFAKICIHDVSPSLTTFIRFFVPFIVLTLYILATSGFKDIAFKISF